jgi:hypothetical protein
MGKIKNISYRVISAALLIAASASAPLFAQPKSKITFISGDNAADAILSNPSGPCVSRLPAWELSIGEGTYSRFAARKSNADCGEAFRAAVRGFTDEEKNTLRQYVDMVDSVINTEFPSLNALPWRFAVISDSTDFGVPASKGYIILTKGLLREMRDWLEHPSKMLFVGMEMLIHEKVLLLQGRNPRPFEKFYREVWGFRKINVLSIDRLMEDNGIYFTSVPPNEWVIKVSPNPKDREYIMPALMMREAGKEGGAVQRVAITIDSTSKGFFPRKSKKTPIEHKDLSFIIHYRKKFPLAEYDYHPAELSADLLAKFLVMKRVSVQYGTAPAKASEYSNIDVLMKMVEEAKK